MTPAFCVPKKDLPGGFVPQGSVPVLTREGMTHDAVSALTAIKLLAKR